MRRISLFINPPAGPSLQETISSLAKSDLFSLHVLKIDSELLPLLLEARPCVCVFSIFGLMPTAWLAALLAELQKLRKSRGGLARDPMLRLIIIAEDQSVPMAVWSKLGVHEVITAPIFANSLNFKIANHYHKAIAAETRSERLAALDSIEFEELKPPEAGWRTFQASHQGLPEDEDSETQAAPRRLVVEADLVKPVDGVWQAEKTASDQSAEGDWEWCRKFGEAQGSDPSGSWRFQGEKPLFDEKKKTWLFTGEKPQLTRKSADPAQPPEVMLECVPKPNGHVQVKIKPEIQVKAVRHLISATPENEREAAFEQEEKQRIACEAQLRQTEVQEQKQRQAEEKLKQAPRDLSHQTKPNDRSQLRPPGSDGAKGASSAEHPLNERAGDQAGREESRPPAQTQPKSPDDKRATPERETNPARAASERALAEGVKNFVSSFSEKDAQSAGYEVPGQGPIRAPRETSEKNPTKPQSPTQVPVGNAADAEKTGGQPTQPASPKAKGPVARVDEVKAVRLTLPLDASSKVTTKADGTPGVVVKRSGSSLDSEAPQKITAEKQLSEAPKVAPAAAQDAEPAPWNVNSGAKPPPDAADPSALPLGESPDPAPFNGTAKAGLGEVQGAFNNKIGSDDKRSSWSQHEDEDSDEAEGSPEARRLRRALRELGAKARKNISDRVTGIEESLVSKVTALGEKKTLLPSMPEVSPSRVNPPAIDQGLDEPEGGLMQKILEAVRSFFGRK